MADRLVRDWTVYTPDAHILLSPDGTVLGWEGAAQQVFGYTAEEALGAKYAELVAPPDRLGEFDRFLSDTCNHGHAGLETLRRRKDGNLIFVVLSGKRIDGSDQTEHRIVLTEKDVTELKARRDGRALEQRFGELLESTPDGLVISNSTGHILVANGQAERLFGYGPGELRARPVDDLLPERFRRPHLGHRNRYFEQPRTRSMGNGLELYGLRKDGTEFPVEISLSPLKSEDSLVVISAIRDVSERRRFEQALQDKNLELENANRAKDRFLASMSHELRTPLNAVIGFTGTLLMKLPGDINDEQTHQLQLIRSSARHLLALINDLLNLAKIEAGKMDLQREVVDCAALLDEVAATLRPQATTKGLSFELALPAEPATFVTDRRALSQILINLINNAIKFTERGYVRVGLSVKDFGGQRRLSVVVEDSGPGIREEELATLFEPFVQGQASRNKGGEGTGLGLHLSRKLAAILDGTLSCESEPGVGSSFTLVLPEM
ncbi:PAS domain S-box protein [Azoarcus sp. KH32C]|uniref:PAS domain-containing sensor histidine kinase n=1 Tax=Azoarcus sp. KH32C TaxID=748247 RepID=UPI0002385EEE|nr:PAS domain S-box protein [Azoarcus sp. KH32C]BAL25034.1 sensory transduction histidine kinase [Azoarcus sp. KH32C]